MMNCYLVPHPHNHESTTTIKSTSTNPGNSNIHSTVPTKADDATIHLKSSMFPQSIGRIELIQSILQTCCSDHSHSSCSYCRNLQTYAPYISKSLLTFGPTATAAVAITETKTETVTATAIENTSCTTSAHGTSNSIQACGSICKLTIQKKHMRLIRINNSVPRKEVIELRHGDIISVISPIIVPSQSDKLPNQNGTTSTLTCAKSASSRSGSETTCSTSKRINSRRVREVMEFTFYCAPIKNGSGMMMTQEEMKMEETENPNMKRVETQIHAKTKMQIQAQTQSKSSSPSLIIKTATSPNAETRSESESQSESQSPMLSMPMHFHALNDASQSLHGSMNVLSALSLTQSPQNQESNKACGVFTDTTRNASSSSDNSNSISNKNNNSRPKTLSNIPVEEMKRYRDTISNNDEKGKWRRLVMNIAIERKEKDGIGMQQQPFPVLLRDTRIE